MQMCDAMRTQGFASPVNSQTSADGEPNECCGNGTGDRKRGVDILKVGYRLSVNIVQYVPCHHDTADSKEQGTDAKDQS
jgi:hypothetical protein